MSALPDGLRHTCPACEASVAYAKTPRMSKGQSVELMIDFAADSGTGGTVPVQIKGDTLYGDAVPKHQANAMRAAALPLHTLHKETCQKRNATRKRP